MAKNIDKSPVKLRKRKLQNGSSSLYLDIYIDGVRKREFLKLYLISDKSAKAREQNKKTLEVANAIRAERLYNIQLGKEATPKKDKMLNISFVEYMENEVTKIKDLRTPSYIKRYRTGISWVKRYKEDTLLKDIDKEWIQGFIHFLTVTKGKHGKLLNQNTIHEYLLYVANILNNAVREGIIQASPMKNLSSADRPKKYGGKRAFLTSEEVQRLMLSPSPAKYNPIRLAFLFSCFCGLRYSDLLQLRWEHIIQKDNEVVICKKIQKTQDMLYLPLNATAINLLPERGSPEQLVFELPKSISTTEMYIKVWTEFAQIDKHVTFHTARHTFAVGILTCGGDIYTLSKLLGHKNVTTTQIYADILGETKQRVVNLLDGFGE